MIQIKVSEIMVGDITQVKYGKKFDFTQLVLSKHDFYESLTPTLSLIRPSVMIPEMLFI